MSIIAYTGLPRHGKSYGVVENQILPALRACRLVVTNIPLYMDVVGADFPGARVVSFPTEEVVKEPSRIFEFAKPGCLLVLDELWKIFPAGQKVSDVPKPFKELLAEHGHMVDESGDAMQIVFVTQDLAQIGAFARQLVEYTYRVVKLSTVGLSKQYRVDVFERAVTGSNPPMSKRVRALGGKYSKKVWRYYKSHTKSEAAVDGANELSIDDRHVLWKNPRFLIGMPVALVVGIACVAVAWRKFHPQRPPAVEKHQAGPPVSHGSAGFVAVAARVAAGRVSAWADADGSVLWAVVESADMSVRLGAGLCRFGTVREVLCRWDGRVYSSLTRAPKLAPEGEGVARVLPGPLGAGVTVGDPRGPG